MEKETKKFLGLETGHIAIICMVAAATVAILAQSAVNNNAVRTDIRYS